MDEARTRPAKDEAGVRWGITLKLTLASSLLITGVSVLLTILYVRHHLDDVQSFLRERGSYAAEQLARDAEYGVLTGQEQLLSNLVEGTTRDPDIIFCRVEDNEGRALAFGGQLPDSTSGISLQEETESSTGGSRIRRLSADGGQMYYEIICPVRTMSIRVSREELTLSPYGPGIHPGSHAESRTIGRVRLGLSLERTHAQVGRIRNIAIATTVSMVLVAILAVAWMVRRTLAPVGELVGGMERIAGGDLETTLVPRSSDEIGFLTSSFNSMVERLKRSRREREVYHRTLELRVEERTRDLRVANERLRDSYQRVQEADRLKAEFMANMSHELRTPLNSVIGFSQVLLDGIDGELNEMQRDDVTSIHNSGTHLLALIEDVLNLAKIDAGLLDLSLEETDLAALLEDVISSGWALVKDTPVEIRLEASPELPLVLVDSRRVRQVLLNLLGNAAKFTNQGHITISAAVEGESALIKVADTGIGIAKEDQAKVFERFRQVDGSTARREGGTGLGLSISQDLVELHGGRLWVESEPGVGSTFGFTLPLHGPPPEGDRETVPPPASTEQARVSSAHLAASFEENAEPKPVPAPPPSGDGESLPPEEATAKKLALLASPSEALADLIEAEMKDQGVSVVREPFPARAAATASRTRPDLIILDPVILARGSWFPILELRHQLTTRGIPILLSSLVPNGERGFSLGDAEFLPCSPSVEALETGLSLLLPGLDGRKVTAVSFLRDASPAGRLRTALEREGGLFRSARGPSEVLSLLRREPVGLLVLDLGIPGLVPLEVLESVKRDPALRPTPLLLLQGPGHGPGEEIQRARMIVSLLRQGIQDREQIAEDISRCIRRHRAPHVPPVATVPGEALAG